MSAKIHTATDGDPTDPAEGLRKQRSDVMEAVIPELTTLDMWALGITTVIGGQYFSWNSALSAGFGSFVIATGLIATGYVCLSLCIAELSSGLPFAGGSYGLARVTAGIFPGYLVACFDSMESVIYTATSTVSIGQMLTEVFRTPESMEPLYWLIFYGTATAINAYGGMLFWRVNMALAVVSFLIVLMYIFGSAKFADFETNATLEDESGLDKWFRGGSVEFMKILPIPCWFFVGVESINLACQDTTEPKKLIPRGYVATIITLLVTCVAVLFVTVSLSPGIESTAEELAIFNVGFVKMFNCSERVAFLFSLPALYATAFGFMFCYGRQLRSMGNSGLLNTEIGKSIEGRNTPGRALALGSIIGLCICMIVYLYPYIGLQLYNICVLGAFNAYFAQFYSYYVFGTKLSSIKREFRSPLGMAGAAVGASIFLLAMVGIIFFQEDNGFAIIVFMVYLIVVSIYYAKVVIDRQYFSKEESEVLLIAHVMTNNMKRGEKPSAFVKFLKKFGLIPKKKKKHTTGNDGGGTTTNASNVGSTMRKAVPSQYSVQGHGNEDVESNKKKSGPAAKAASVTITPMTVSTAKDMTTVTTTATATTSTMAFTPLEANVKGIETEPDPMFEITGDTRHSRFAADDDADGVVPYQSLKSMMDEADHAHSALRDVDDIVRSVSSKKVNTHLMASDGFQASSLWTPREHVIPEQTRTEPNSRPASGGSKVEHWIIDEIAAVANHC